MNAEDKEAQILDKKTEIEGEPLTDKEEFQILAGQGIEYKTGNITFIIPNIKVCDYLKMIEFEEKQKLAKGASEVLDLQMEFISQYTKASKEDLINNMDKQDCDKVLALMFYSWLEGKAIFKKKIISYEEICQKILMLRGLHGVMKNAGL